MLSAEVISSLLGPASPAASLGYTPLRLAPKQIPQKGGLGDNNQTEDIFTEIESLRWCFDPDPLCRLDVAIF